MEHELSGVQECFDSPHFSDKKCRLEHELSGVVESSLDSSHFSVRKCRLEMNYQELWKGHLIVHISVKLIGNVNWNMTYQE